MNTSPYTPIRDLSDRDYDTVCNSGRCGFSPQVVMADLARHNIVLHECQVWYIWAKEGIHLKTYRQGGTPLARRVYRTFVLPQIKVMRKTA